MLQKSIIAKTDPFFDICFSYSESTSIINVCNATEGANPKEDQADEEHFENHIFFRFLGCRIVLGRCRIGYSSFRFESNDLFPFSIIDVVT